MLACFSWWQGGRCARSAPAASLRLGALLLALAAGCSAVVDIDRVPDGGMAFDGGDAARRLLALGERSRVLVPGERTSLQVLYTDETGEPLAGEPVRFDLVGEALDSSLEAVEVVADEEGIGSVVLVAGRAPTSFRVRARAELAAEAWFGISVEPAIDGALRVVVEPYRGARRVEEVAVRVARGGACSDPGMEAGEVLASARLPAGGGSERFERLPAGEPLHVEAVGLDAADRPVARACTPEVVAEPGMGGEVRLVPGDLPLRWRLVSARVALSSAEAAAWTADLLAPVLERELVVRGGLAGALLDATVAVLREAGQARVAERLAAHAESDPAFEEQLGLQWRADGGISALESVLRERLAALHGLQLVAGGSGEAGAEPPVLRVLDVLDADGGSLGSPEDGWTLRLQPGRLLEDAFPSLRLLASVPLGTLAARRLEGDASFELPGCLDAASWAASQPGVPRGADERAWRQGCERLADELLVVAADALRARDVGVEALHLEGEVEAAWSDGVTVVGLAGEALQGGWAPTGTEEEPVVPARGVLQADGG